MKFIFADSLDHVDPNYDFLEDRSPPNREPYWDDVYPHELFGYAPYHGILVSRAIVGGHQGQGKYTESQAMRFRRVGAREFLRFREKDFPGSLIYGDCGAFSYHKLETPPYTADDAIDFYGDGGFTHGCSVDHIIFDFIEMSTGEEQHYLTSDDDTAKENRRRFEITIENAHEFITKSKRLGTQFTPLGVVQGWSPLSMAKAASELVRMGYRYIAIGGMVPLKAAQIHKALDAIRDEIGYDIPLHILGFAKADEIAEFLRHKIASFDTTSPLIRAFKDARNNYYLPGRNGGLEYFSAVRIPQALQNNTLQRLVKAGAYTQEDLQKRERTALATLRAYDDQGATLEDTLESIMDYTKPLVCGREKGLSETEERKIATIRDRTLRTLEAKPWNRCACAICAAISVEVIIFRASNRNKRRGMHNINVYNQHVSKLVEKETHDTHFDLQCHKSAAE